MFYIVFLCIFFLNYVYKFEEIPNKKSQVIDQRFANLIATAIVNLNSQLDALYGLSLDYGRLKVDNVVEELKKLIRYFDN